MVFVNRRRIGVFAAVENVHHRKRSVRVARPNNDKAAFQPDCAAALVTAIDTLLSRWRQDWFCYELSKPIIVMLISDLLASKPVSSGAMIADGLQPPLKRLPP